jgi:hypothetical protein
MCSSAVGVNDYLSACKTAVANWSADNKSAGRIYKNAYFVIEPFLRDYWLYYVFNKISTKLFLCYIFIMLSRNEYSIYSYSLAVLIDNGYLSFSVGAKIFKSTILADFRKSVCKSVCQ